MAREVGKPRSELEKTRQALTQTRRGLATLAENYRKGTAQRLEKITRLEAKIAELELEESKCAGRHSRLETG